MLSRCGPRFQRFVTAVLLTAALAFPYHSALAAMAQAAASTGSTNEPAVLVSGPVHQHGRLSGMVHVHDGDNTPGHVHHDDEDAGMAQVWSLGCVTAVIPLAENLAVSFSVQSAVLGSARKTLVGVDPDGLNRPPSTPGIT